IKWTNTNADATGADTQTAWVDNINITLNAETEPFDYPADTTLTLPAEYTTDTWINQNTVAYGGVGFAAKAGAVYNATTTYMQRHLNLTSAQTDGMLNFIWKTSDGVGKSMTVEVYDATNNLIAQTSITGGVDWQAITPIALAKGQIYTVKWIYTNTEATGDDTQTAWVDNINVALNSETEPFDYPDNTTVALPAAYTTDSWVDQNAVAYGDSGFAARAGAVYNGTTTYMQRIVNLTAAETDGKLNFVWKASDGAGKAMTLEIYDGLNNLVAQTSIAGGTDWQAIDPITLAKGQNYIIKWIYVNTEATGDDAQTAWVDNINITLNPETEPFEYPADTILALPTEYTTDVWINQNTIAYGGVGFAARSGAVYNGATTYMQRTVDLAQSTMDGTLNFMWKTSEGAGKAITVEVYDSLNNLIGQVSIAGGTDWQAADPIILAKGQVYTIKWTYTNTDATGDDTQTAWVDNINVMLNAEAEPFDYPANTIINLPAEYTTDTWVDQNVLAYDDSGFAAQAGVVYNGATTYMQRQVNLTGAQSDGNLNFVWKTSDGAGKALTVEVYDSTNNLITQQTIAGGADWQQAETITLAKGQTYTVKWIYTNAEATGDDTQTAWVDSINVTLDAATEPFDYPADTTLTLPPEYTTDSWVNQNTLAYNGVGFAAKSGAIYNGATTYMQRTVDLSQAAIDAMLNFVWKTSDGAGKALAVEVYDSMNNLVAQTSIAGGTDWQAADPITLAKGQVYTIKWTYTNTEATGDDTQTAWVDNINVTLKAAGEIFDYPENTTITLPVEYTTDTWVNQNILAYGDVGFAAKAGAVYNGATAYMQRQLDLTEAQSDGNLNFVWKTSEGAGKAITVEVYDSLNNLVGQVSIAGGTDWQAISPIALAKGQIYTVKWTYTNTEATGDDTQTAWVDNINVVLNAQTELFDYPANTTVALPAAYTTDSWVDQNIIAYGDTGFAAQSGAVYNGATTYMQRQVNLTTTETDGQLSFVWKASEGAGKAMTVEVYDSFNNLIAQQTIAGGTDWQTITPITLAKGQAYTIKWTYTNTEATGDSAQTAWVDNINITLDTEEQSFDHPANTTIALPAEYTTDSWVDQNALAYGDIGFAAQAGAVYSGATTYMQRQIDLVAAQNDGNLNFVWKTSDGAGKALTVEVYDNLNNLVAQASIAGGADWQTISPITLAKGQVYTVKWIYTNTEATGDDTQTAWVDSINVMLNTEEQSFDHPANTTIALPVAYTTDLWVSQNTLAYGDTGFAAKAGAVYNSATAYMQRTIDLSQAALDGQLNFVWKTSEGAGKALTVEVYDSLNNLVAQTSIAGGVDWQTITPITLAKGQVYTIKWTYANTEATGDDTQTAWVDNINVTLNAAGQSFDYPANTALTLPIEYTTDSWVEQNTLAYGGAGFAAKAGAVYNGATTYMQRQIDLTTAEIDAKLNFLWKTSDGEGKALAVEVYDSLNNLVAQASLASGMDWQAISPITLAKGQIYTVKWIYTNTEATGDDTQTAWVDNINISLNTETESFDYPANTTITLPVEYATDSWVDQNITAYGDTGFAAKSGAVYDGATTYMQRQVDLTVAQNDGILNFVWKTSEGAGKTMTVEIYDGLNSLIAQQSVTGGMDWQAISPITLAKGQIYTVKWIYTNTEATGDDAQTAWVDNINVDLATETESFDYPANTTITLPVEYVTDSWVDQNITAYRDTGFAAKAGAAYNGATTYMQRQMNLTFAEKDGKLSFVWKTSEGAGKTMTVEVYDSLNNLVAQETITGGTDWQAIDPITLAKGQTYTVKWTYTNTEATGDDAQTAWVDNINVTLDPKLHQFEYPAGVSITLPAVYTTDSWVDQNTVAYGETGFAAKAGAVYSSATTYMQRQVNLTTATTDGHLNFAWKASDGAGKALTVEVYDSLNNLVAQETITGGTDWQDAATITLAKGQAYTVKWIYANTAATGDDAQTAWVDNIKLTLAPETEWFDYPPNTTITLPAIYTTDSWVDQNTIVYGETGFAAKAGAVYSGASAYMQRTVDLSQATTDGTLSFIWKTSTGDKQLKVEVYDSLNNLVGEQTVAGGVDWQQASVSVTKGQVYTIKWIYVNNEATGDDAQTAWVDDFKVILNVSEAFDRPSNTVIALPSVYTTDSWVDQNTVAYGGVGFAAKAGAVYSGATTYMERTVDLSQASTDGTLNFNWKTSTGDKQLKIEIYDSLDNLVSEQTIAGGADWQAATAIALAKGQTYRIRWTYINNEATGDDAQTAWVDDIKVALQGQAQVFDYPADTTLTLPSVYTTDSWVDQNTVAYGGVGFAAKAGAVYSGATTYMERTVDLSQA
ncbi:MAG: hypothetical protein WC359_14150, partial [Dehalococcoidia bacterium]